MDNRCIGVFDSGLGGLTAVRSLMDLLPNERLVYFGDTGRVPYGSRTEQTIIKYVKEDIEFLLTKNPKVILAACGTAGAVALEVVSGSYNVPILGVVQPAAAAAAAATKNGRVGVIGTGATIKSGKYMRVLRDIERQIEVFSVACPLFVPLVENGHTHSVPARIIAEEYLDPLKKANVDTIILGCTHYPLLFDIISDIMGDKVRLIDSGFESARALAELLKATQMLGEDGSECSYYVSDDQESFARLGGIFLRKQINTQCERVEI